MGKITMQDDCFTPEKYVYLRYSGKAPWTIAHKIAGLIKPHFHISSSGSSNTRINWDVSSDPIAFYSIWWAKKPYSRWTKMMVHMKLQGTKSKTTNEGEFTLQLNGDLVTVFGGWSVFLKPVWLFYSYVFYNRARRKYLESCRNSILDFRNELKKHFDIKATNIPSEAGVFG